ncbi:uncharacterized protein LOC109859508 [Pseudomyrmex gracilis]|uniref:uncharacterized protein LOC109859508 n=1 Tax=Pseudomyrmex gracilis TaxID=219809 RepID=UPI000994EC2F|nr:uncharacterized protein LOC109859508 [Pseudomyrmex gracilis]
MIIVYKRSRVINAMKLIYIGLTFLALASAELKLLDDIEPQYLNVNINDLVDRFNPEISQLIIDHGLDPLILPRVETKLWKKADLVLYSGILNHLSAIKRCGNVILNYEDQIAMNASFKFNDLEGQYKYTLDVGIFDFLGGIVITVADVHAKISVTYHTTNYTLVLDKLKLETVGSIKVKVQDENGAVSWIKTAIVNFIIPYFKNTIMNSVEQEARSEIQKYFDGINSKTAPKVSPSLIISTLNMWKMLKKF